MALDAAEKLAAEGYKKNVYTLSCGFFGIFMAFQTAQVRYRAEEA